MEIPYIRLYELQQTVKSAFKEAFTETYWVAAEISELKVNRSGHCYLELAEKAGDKDKIIAKARAIIWSDTYFMLKPYFEHATGYELKDGLKVLVSVSVEFHEIYGYSLNIKDIDPTYTLGDIARKRQEIIERLTNEGVMDMNRSLDMPLVPQKIAVISSATAAGYQDWRHQTENNSDGYRFYHKLFSAYMQGDQAESSIIHALERIYEHDVFFDVVVIIRGGGAVSDLGCFDSYRLAFHVAQFPLPVITGIGHEKDETILDMVAHTKVKTPTAAAEYLVERAATFESKLGMYFDSITGGIENGIAQHRNSLERLCRQVYPVFMNKLEKNKHVLQLYLHRIDTGSGRYVQRKQHALSEKCQNIPHLASRHTSGAVEKLKTLRQSVKYAVHKYLISGRHKLELLQTASAHASPENALKKGYTITMKNNKIIKSKKNLKKEDRIETVFGDGSVISKIE